MQDGLQTPSIGSDGFATIPKVPIDTIANRVAPRQVTSGVTRGTQTIMNIDGSYVTLGLIPDGGTSFGIAFFDANGNLISKDTGTTRTTYNSAGIKTLVSGLLDTGEYGLAFYDTSGNLIRKILGATMYTYDPVNGNVNITQDGLLPDGTHGWAVAATGKNVADGFS